MLYEVITEAARVPVHRDGRRGSRDLPARGGGGARRRVPAAQLAGPAPRRITS